MIKQSINLKLLLSTLIITSISLSYANDSTKNDSGSFFFGLFSSSDSEEFVNRPVKINDTTYIDFNTGQAKDEIYEEEQLQPNIDQQNTEQQYTDQLLNENPYADSRNSSKDSVSKNPLIETREHKTKFGKHDPYYGKHLCGNGEYSCIKIKKSDTWKSLFPNDYQRELVQRLNRTNSGLWNRSWLLVPNTFSKDYLKYSPLPAYRSDITEKTIVVDQKELAFGAYDSKGELLHWGPVNPGKAGTKTALGSNFKVYRKGGANCWSKKFDSSIPYCIFFNGGYALHGFHMPGYPASHGCVRMNNSDAKWLNKEFADYKTRVIVKDINS